MLFRSDARYITRTATWGTCEKRILVEQLATQDNTTNCSEVDREQQSRSEFGAETRGDIVARARKQQVAASTRDAGTSL